MAIFPAEQEAKYNVESNRMYRLLLFISIAFTQFFSLEPKLAIQIELHLDLKQKIKLYSIGFQVFFFFKNTS
jgi:hypothetical protein